MIFTSNLVLLEKVVIFLLEHEAWKLFMTETFLHSPAANNKSTATLSSPFKYFLEIHVLPSYG